MSLLHCLSKSKCSELTNCNTYSIKKNLLRNINEIILWLYLQCSQINGYFLSFTHEYAEAS